MTVDVLVELSSAPFADPIAYRPIANAGDRVTLMKTVAFIEAINQLQYMFEEEARMFAQGIAALSNEENYRLQKCTDEYNRNSQDKKPEELQTLISKYNNDYSGIQIKYNSAITGRQGYLDSAQSEVSNISNSTINNYKNASALTDISKNIANCMQR
jgi:hypothetical protein